jgi:hypothetical protein
MKNLRPILFAVLLALPVVGVLGLVAEKQLSVAASTAVRLPIAGYDPRDLMYGHYLHFRFDGPSAPDKSPHEYFIPEDFANELGNLLGGTGKHTIELEVFYSGKRVTSYGMLYVDNQPWRDFLNSHKAK